LRRIRENNLKEILIKSAFPLENRGKEIKGVAYGNQENGGRVGIGLF
jgi:hypothetical protein